MQKYEYVVNSFNNLGYKMIWSICVTYWIKTKKWMIVNLTIYLSYVFATITKYAAKNCKNDSTIYEKRFLLNPFSKTIRLHWCKILFHWNLIRYLYMKWSCWCHSPFLCVSFISDKHTNFSYN